MEWKFRSDLPIYAQIVEQFRQSIVSGKLSPGQRLESVRDLSMEAGVNPNTMQRALQELEREGLVYTQRTAGRFVSEDAAVIERGKRAMAMEKIREFLSAMNSLGYSREEILSLLSEEKEEENNADS
jgi:DNA-binding transcriptional regulator YhcF (GntR family)